MFPVLAGSLCLAPHPKPLQTKATVTKLRLLPPLAYPEPAPTDNYCRALVTRLKIQRQKPHPNRGHRKAGPQILRISPEEDGDIVIV